MSFAHFCGMMGAAVALAHTIGTASRRPTLTGAPVTHNNNNNGF